VGEALSTISDPKDVETLHEMAEQWPFFRSLLSMVEMVLAKADLDIFSFYETRLVPSALHAVGDALRLKFTLTENAVKAALNVEKLLALNPILLRTLMLRSPYLYPLHVLQAELLCRLRQQGNAAKNVNKEDQNALMITISGIAAGMQNTG
jgi:phosphoenolpyruvate carboxylase